MGLEPTTFCLGSKTLYQLSYTRVDSLVYARHGGPSMSGLGQPVAPRLTLLASGPYTLKRLWGD